MAVIRFSLFFLLVLVVPAFSQALCTISSETKLRVSPGAKTQVSWVVPKFTPLLEIQRKGNWIQVQDQDGENHWVYGTNVTSKFVCVSVRVSAAKLRKNPGVDGEAASIRQVDRYTPFKRIDLSGEWVQVEAPWGEVYWLHESTIWRPVRVSSVGF